MQFYSGLCVPRWYVGDRTGLRVGRSQSRCHKYTFGVCVLGIACVYGDYPVG